MSSIREESKDIWFIVTLKDCEPEDLLQFGSLLLEVLPQMGARRYFFALHDLDKHEDGSPKSPHYHCYAEMSDRKRLSTWINQLSKKLQVSPFAISLEKPTSTEGCVQYLIHKKNPEKYQYERNRIVTNCPQDELEIILNAETSETSFDFFLRVIEESPSLTEVIRKVGIGKYQRWRPVILDLWKAVKLGMNR